MGSILGAVLVLGLVAWGTVKAGKSSDSFKPVSYATTRCPTCGAKARVYGSTWECGWCGDFGRYTRK